MYHHCPMKGSTTANAPEKQQPLVWVCLLKLISSEYRPYAPSCCLCTRLRKVIKKGKFQFGSLVQEPRGVDNCQLLDGAAPAITLCHICLCLRVSVTDFSGHWYFDLHCNVHDLGNSWRMQLEASTMTKKVEMWRNWKTWRYFWNSEVLSLMSYSEDLSWKISRRR